MKLYLAGPMRLKPAYNAFAFHDTATELRQHGYDVVTPIEIDNRVDPTFDHQIHKATPKQVKMFQHASLIELAKCDGVAMLPGWRESKGVQTELDLACAFRIPCGEVLVWLCLAKNRNVKSKGV